MPSSVRGSVTGCMEFTLGQPPQLVWPWHGMGQLPLPRLHAHCMLLRHRGPCILCFRLTYACSPCHVMMPLFWTALPRALPTIAPHAPPPLQTFAEKLAKLQAAEGGSAPPAEFSLNFLWLDKNIAVAVDQVFGQVRSKGRALV